MSNKTKPSYGSGAPLLDLPELDSRESVYDKPPEERYIKIPSPEWAHWEMMPLWSIQDAIALSLDLEPRDFQMLLKGKITDPEKLPDWLDVSRFYKRLQIAQACVLQGEFAVKCAGQTVMDSMIVATEFIAWAIEKGFSIPERLRTFYTTESNRQERQISKNIQSINIPNPNKSDKLTILNQASQYFWATQERGDKANWPKNSTVVAWLMDRGFTKRTAESGATIIRPEWAVTGRLPEE